MTFHIYIQGNSIGRARITGQGGLRGEIVMDREVQEALRAINEYHSCCASMRELARGGYSYMTFGNRIGEIKVI